MSEPKIAFAKPKFEEMFLRRLVVTPRWHHFIKYMLPGFYSTPTTKYICHAMKRLQERGIKITKHNITLFLAKEVDVSIFKRKLKLPVVDVFDVERVLNEQQMSEFSEDDIDFVLENGYEDIAELAFKRFVKERISEIAFQLQYTDVGASISATANSITRMFYLTSAHKMKSKMAKRVSGISKAKAFINNANTVIPTFSTGINKYIRGWTRGYPNTLMARSGHGKSSFISNECRHKVEKSIVDKVAVISVEEGEELFWQRMFAAEFNVSTTAMRAGLATMTDEQEQALHAKYNGKVDFFHEGNKYKDVISLLFSLRDYELIYIDHINAIEYPGSGNALQNMIGQIPSLISREKDFLSRNKDISIINVNQVAEKQIDQIRDYWKFPYHELAYGNSVSWIASREWVTLYYPYKDMVNRPLEWAQVEKHSLPTNQDIFVKVEKSSFTDIGDAQLHFDFEHSRMTDAHSKGIAKSEIEFIQEEIFSNEISKKKR